MQVDSYVKVYGLGLGCACIIVLLMRGRLSKEWLRCNNMQAENDLCSICGNFLAEMFCPCTSPETLLCVHCVGLHFVKRGNKAHAVWLIAQLPYYKIPGYAERNEARIEQFPQVRTQAVQQVALIDKAIEEFTEEIEMAIGELAQYRDNKVGELREMRAELSRDVESAIEEVERTLMEDQPVLTSRMGSAFRALTEHLQPVELFSYNLTTSSTQAVVTLNSRLHPPLLHPPQHFQTDLFAAIDRDRMALYDFTTQETTCHGLSTWMFSGYIQVDKTTVLIVGKEVWTLDLLTLQTTPLAPLLTPRKGVGIAQVGNTVFAFGGYGHGTVCEKSNFPLTCWTPLPPMHYGRSGFTPCPFKALLYLVSTTLYDHKAVESFSPNTETFTVLPVSLPVRLRLGWGSVAFVADGELFLLTGDAQMACWDIESNTQFSLYAMDRGCWSFQPPLIVGTLVYIANGRNVERFSLEEFSFV